MKQLTRIKTALLALAHIPIVLATAHATTAYNSGSLGGLGNGTNTPGVVLNQPGAVAAGGDYASGYSGGQRTTVSYQAALNPPSGSPFTIEFWTQPSAVTDDSVGPCPLFNRVSSGNRSGWVFFQRSPTTGWNFRMYDGSGSNVGWDLTGGSYSQNVWCHVVAVWDGSSARLYVNGALADDTNASGKSGLYNASTAATFSVGSYDDGANAYNGLMDEVAFYPSALTAEQILAHYNTASSATVGAYSSLALTDGALEYLQQNSGSGRILILSDNFNAPDTGDFDNSVQTGRRGGLLAGNVWLRSSMVQHGILNNQLNFLTAGGEARIRFHDANNLANWWDWASGVGGAAIKREGGMRVEFDWTPADNTSDNWISFDIGFPNSGGEPAVRVNDAGTDFGILFRNRGATQFFDNGVATGGPNFDVSTVTTHHVMLDYAFTSFADGSPVAVTVSVDGTPILSRQPFQWAGNGGTLAMELGNYVVGTKIDNFAVSTLNNDTDADGLPDDWEMAKAGNLTDLTGLLNGPGPGPGTGNYDGDTLTDAQEYAYSAVYPGLNPMLADSDGDGLEDGSELTGAGLRPPTDPTKADSDGDGLSDALEDNSGLFVDAANPGTNPMNSDTDGDQYPDGYEAQHGSDPLLASSLPTAVPAGVTLGQITDDASTGVSTSETYTHKISGGGAASINGVDLEVLDTTATPANFTWNPSTGVKNIVAPINNGAWDPAAGGVTGPGVLSMLGCFSYSSGIQGSSQEFTLSGLEAGLTYELRIYIRKWDNATVRPAALKFINGAQATDFYILEDRPGTVLGNGNNESAYYISYTYVAEGASLVIDATVPNVSSAHDSFHLYGLTNRKAGPPVRPEFTGIVRASDGSLVTLTIKSMPGRTYAVDVSTDLVTWVELTATLASQGTQTVYEDTQVSNLPHAFYRLRDVTP